MRNFFKKQNSFLTQILHLQRILRVVGPLSSWLRGRRLRNSLANAKFFTEKNKEKTFKGVLSATARKLQDFLSFKKSVPAKSLFLYFFSFLILILIFSPLSTSAAINKQINYQGKLTTSAGVAVADGTYNMEFVLYDDPTLGGAHILWTETRTTTDKVQVTSGLFSVLLGEVTALTGVDFNQTLYLGVNIGGTGTPGWDGEMTPRKKLGAVPAAIVSESAINIIGGVAGAVPYQSAASTTLFSAAGTTGQSLISGGTGSPTWFAPTAGSVLFAGTSGILQQDNANLFWDDSADRLGIGTATPGAKLDVRGAANAWTGIFLADSTAGQSFGLDVRAGTNSSDMSLRVMNRALNSTYFLVRGDGNVGIGTTTPGSILALGGTVARTFGMDRNAIEDTAGQGFTISSGGAIAGTANLAGGDLTLKSGISTGTGSSAIHFFTATAGVSATTDRTPTEKMTILGTGNVGIGTTGPSALLNLEGTLSSALTGTVSVTISTAAVVGVGTAFTTELAVGDSIKIGSEIFTVSVITDNTNLTLDSNHTAGASGVTAYRDPTLLAIDNGDAVNKLTITKSGNVGIGTTSPDQKLEVVGGIAVSSPDSDTVLSGSETQTGIALMSNGAYWGIRQSTNKYFNLDVYNSGSQLTALTIQQNGNVGIGTVSPSALLNLKGTLSSALTGTVSVTISTAAVVGVGTAFTTELAVGDSIKIGSEIFTVSVITDNTNLTLDSNHTAGASGVTAYRDPTLLAIDNGDAVNKLTITKSGNVGIGTTSPGYPLDVNGAINVLGANRITWGGRSDTSIMGGVGTGFDLGISATNNMLFAIDANNDETTNAFIFYNNNEAHLATNELMRIQENGNVGIGTTDPATKLDVSGTIRGTALRLHQATDTLTQQFLIDSGTKTNWQISTQNNIDNGFEITPSTAVGGTTFSTPALAILATGNVGIGTTNPVELLSLGTAGTTKGVLSLAGVTSGKIIVQPADAAGTWTMTLPTAVGGAGEQLTDVAGNGVTSWAAAASSRQSKDIIGTINDPSEALTQILSTPIYRFNYKPGMGTGDSTTEYVGVMADEALWAMHFNGTIVNPVNTLGYMVLGIQATNKKISDLTLIVTDNFAKQTSVNETLLASIQELDLKISDLSATQIGTPATTLGQYAELFFSDVVYNVENGVAYMKALVVDTLKIGSPDKRTGITLYDEISGEPYCISVANGETKTTAGECVVIERSVAEVDEPVNDNPQDTTPPVITLNGSSEVNLDINDTYTEEGASATDDIDGEIAIIISGSINTSTTGIYIVTYTATDTAGNTATVTRTVNVGDVVVTPEPLAPEPQPEAGQPSAETPESEPEPELIPEPNPSTDSGPSAPEPDSTSSPQAEPPAPEPIS